MQGYIITSDGRVRDAGDSCLVVDPGSCRILPGVILTYRKPHVCVQIEGEASSRWIEDCWVFADRSEAGAFVDRLEEAGVPVLKIGPEGDQPDMNKGYSDWQNWVWGAAALAAGTAMAWMIAYL